MWFPREISAHLEPLVATRPVVILTGARQTGKTSLLERALPSFGYVSLDLPRDAEQAEQAGEEFLARHPPPAIIDEVQYAPRLLRHLKRAVDRNRDRAGLYVLTGSQKLSLMQGVTESLAGRASILELHSLSLAEIERGGSPVSDRERLLDLVFRGGYPEVHAKSIDPRRFHADYVATYLERDVRQALNVRSLRDFDRFLRLCAVRTGQLLNMSSLAGDAGVTPATIRSWLSVLEASNVVHLLPPFHRNLGKRLVKTPKLYFLDTGLACHLAGFDSISALASSSLLGAFFETYVFGQIVRAFTNRARPPRIYFFRDHHGTEVDFVVPVGERAHLLECKWQRGASSSGLHTVAEALGPAKVLSTTLVTGDVVTSRTAAGVDVRGPSDFGWLVGT